MPEPVYLPAAFAQTVAAGVDNILSRQQPDGSIVYDPAAPIIYPQQAIMPLAFCYAGFSPNPDHRHSPRLLQSIRKLGDFLVSRFDDHGRFHYNSYGNDVNTVDQRLTYAWTEALRMLREAGADIPFDPWADKILRACDYLMEHRLKKLVGLRRFISRVLGTSTNHVALYVTTLYRAGQVLNKKELCDFALPIGRALAADVHPDGYWEEHGDLLRNGGPTPSYNYLTHCGMALMHEWTGEQVFARAVEKSSSFHANFPYPDATFLDLIDERVRYNNIPRIWGLFGFSHTPGGRGSAQKHFTGWLATHDPLDRSAPESLARHCENFLYWHDGPTAPAPFETANHHAALSLPASVTRRGAWFIGLSAIPATNPEDPAYRDNPFGLDRQKLLSVWHEKTGLILDGSHSKNQRDNSTFAARAEYADDYYPSGGTVGEDHGDLVVQAAYKTFFGHIRVRPLSDSQLQIELSIDPAGNRGPFAAGFTLLRLAESLAESLAGLNGRKHALTENTFSLTASDLGGGFTYGPLQLTGPADMQVQWPLAPFNSYAADNKSAPSASQLRIHIELTPDRPKAVFLLAIV